MGSIVDIFIENFYAIAGAMLCITFAGHIRYRNSKKNRMAEASAKFRNKVLTALKGLYPNTVDWPKDADVKYGQALPAIESAVAEFKCFIPSLRKEVFDAVFEECRNNRYKMTHNTRTAYVMYPDMRKPGEQSPEEIFKDSIEALLLFANQI